jgi:hypothetical protein
LVRGATVLPLTYVVFFWVVVLVSEDPSWLIPQHFAMVAISAALVVVTLVDVSRNDSLGPNERQAWTVLVLLFSPISMPLYAFVVRARAK